MIRLSNVKSFLDEGRYIPAEKNSTLSIHHLTRTMKDIDPSRPLRFILVEGPEQFKPEYWDRVVAVFTTGQLWQFKNYKWSTPRRAVQARPRRLHRRARRPPPPRRPRLGAIASSPALSISTGSPACLVPTPARWRDREVVETIWKAIEANMRSKGWKRDSGPTHI